MRRVGIIGGMGPLATIDLYAKIVAHTNAVCDQENIPLIIDSYAQIPDRTAFILGESNAPSPLPYLLESAMRLRNSGCEAICMACNTAHFFADDIEKECGVKILRINEIAVSALKNSAKDIKEISKEAKNIAVIATKGTKKAQIYDNVLQKEGFTSVDICKELEENIMECIYKGVKAGQTARYQELFNQTINSIKADKFIAACTEIPILTRGYEGDRIFIDATDELAKYIVEFARS